MPDVLHEKLIDQKNQSEEGICRNEMEIRGDRGGLRMTQGRADISTLSAFSLGMVSL